MIDFDSEVLNDDHIILVQFCRKRCRLLESLLFCLALPCIALHCLALPCLALPHFTLLCFTISHSLTFFPSHPLHHLLPIPSLFLPPSFPYPTLLYSTLLFSTLHHSFTIGATPLQIEYSVLRASSEKPRDLSTFLFSSTSFPSKYLNHV